MPNTPERLVLPASRHGSGTSWLPDSTPMHALHGAAAGWQLMFHGLSALQFDRQGSARGASQLGLVNWQMAMAERSLGGGQLRLSAMTSLEPLTIRDGGYPLLLQSGESYKGEPLHDRQHPHDLWMELSAAYEIPLSGRLGVMLYAAPVGEPALGPVAFMHRPSAEDDPMAPLGHHWQDATHITFGVLTAGVYSKHWKLEGSLFNGREPDETRWDFDVRGRRLDSWSGRLTVNPTGRLSLAAWYGYLDSPEGLHPDESLRRYGASLIRVRQSPLGGTWSSTVLWSVNDSHGARAQSALAESRLALGSRHAVFARLERVQKSADDLAITGASGHGLYDINSVVLGLVRDVWQSRNAMIAAGVRGAVNFVPRALEAEYGTRTPMGVNLFVRVRAGGAPMSGAMEHMHADVAIPRGRAADEKVRP